MAEWFETTNRSFEKIEGKLFMFPYAGGGASAFRKWQGYFDHIKLFAAQYPGRENRMTEKPIDKFQIILENLYEFLSKNISEETPYYLFGHSLGTKFVYELVLKIKENKLPLPRGIIVSAGKAPCYKEEKPIYDLGDDEFIKEINRFSATPREIIKNYDIMKMFLPMLRADFILDETYANSKVKAIDVPILGMMGTEDRELTIEQLMEWGKYTTRGFLYTYIEGGHMFINTNTENVIKEIKKFIGELND